jgi:AcrR family transcriptional regulator
MADPARNSSPAGSGSGTGSGADTDSTRSRLLDAAERMFSENGISATSLRAITSEAGANLAAVNYHFGSKAGLIEEVYARRIRPLNEERLRLLEEARQTAGNGPVPLEAILRAFVEPVRLACGDPRQGGVRFLRLMARVNMEPGEEVRQLVYRQFVQTGMHFQGALREALPHLRPDEIFVRFRFALGAMFFTFAQVLDPERLGIPGCSGSAVEEHAMDDLVTFLAAGFRAPATHGGAK